MGGYMYPENLLNTIYVEFVPGLIPTDFPVGPVEEFGVRAVDSLLRMARRFGDLFARIEYMGGGKCKLVFDTMDFRAQDSVVELLEASSFVLKAERPKPIAGYSHQPGH